MYIINWTMKFTGIVMLKSYLRELITHLDKEKVYLNMYPAWLIYTTLLIILLHNFI